MATGTAPDQDLRPRQGPQLVQQTGLVGLDRDHQMPTPGGHRVGMPDLGVQSIGNDQRAVQGAERRLAARVHAGPRDVAQVRAQTEGPR